MVAGAKSEGQMQIFTGQVLTFTGDPFAEGTYMGPVIDASACERILGVIERAKSALDDAGIEIPFPHLQFHLDAVTDDVWKGASQNLRIEA